MTAPITEVLSRRWAIDKLDKLADQIPYEDRHLPPDLRSRSTDEIIHWFLGQGKYTKATVLAVRHALTRGSGNIV